jgi:hypothetical protein
VEYFAGLLAGDFDVDYDVDVTDYLIMSSHFLTDVLGLTLAETYALGDITQDHVIDGHDYIGFRQAYLDANGAPFLGVPEPAAGSLSVATWAGLFFVRLANRTRR